MVGLASMAPAHFDTWGRAECYTEDRSFRNENHSDGLIRMICSNAFSLSVYAANYSDLTCAKRVQCVKHHVAGVECSLCQPEVH